MKFTSFQQTLEFWCADVVRYHSFSTENLRSDDATVQCVDATLKSIDIEKKRECFEKEIKYGFVKFYSILI